MTFREVGGSRAQGMNDARPAPHGGMPFDPPNCQGVTKAGIACTGPRAKSTMYCVGHLRQRGELNVDEA